MAKQKTVTFQPESDVLDYLEQANRRGRGVRTRIINQALRECGPQVLKQWDRWRKPKRSFQHADPRSGSLQFAA